MGKDVEVIRHPSYIELLNVKDIETTEYLKKGLSVWDQSTFRYNFSAYIEDDEEDRIIIPGGYNTSLLYRYYPVHYYTDKHLDFDEYKTFEGNLNYLPKDDIQRNSVNFLNQEKYSQKYLALQTGMGKTYCAIYRILYTEKLPLIIVDSDLLVEQWVERILEYTDINEDNIYVIKGKPSVNRLSKMKEEKKNRIKFYIALYGTLESIIKNYGYNSLYEFIKGLSIGIKVFDEAHYFFKSIFRIDCCSRCETLYLSATPKRTDKSEDKVYERIFSNVGYHQQGFKTKYLTSYLYSFNSNCDIGYTFHTRRGFGVVDFNKYLDERCFNLICEIILDLLRMIYHDDYSDKRKIFISLGLIKTVNSVTRFLKDYFHDNNVDMKVNALTGEVKSKTAKKEVMNSDIVVITHKSFCKALDIKNLDIFINFVPISSDGPFNQTVGRVRPNGDNDVYFIQCYDRSIDEMSNFLYNNTKFLKKLSKKIVKFNGIGMKKKGIDRE